MLGQSMFYATIDQYLVGQLTNSYTDWFASSQQKTYLNKNEYIYTLLVLFYNVVFHVCPANR